MPAVSVCLNRWFVKKVHFRNADQGEGNSKAFLKSERQLIGHVLRMPLEIEYFRKVIASDIGIISIQSVKQTNELKMLRYGEIVK